MYYQLTESERYTLSVLRREERTLRAIAQALGRSPSTISREVRRNATLNAAKVRSFYVPSKAQEHANGRRSRSRLVKHHGPEVYAHIEARLSEVQWSPEQDRQGIAPRAGRDESYDDLPARSPGSARRWQLVQATPAGPETPAQAHVWC